MRNEPLAPTRPPYWFHAKRFGWGWGLPARWEGWVVMAVWLVAVVAGAVLIAPWRMALYVPFMFLMAGLLIGVCYWKGEPPRWRWDGTDDGQSDPGAR